MIKAIAIFIAASAIFPYVKSWESYWWKIDATFHGQGSFIQTDNMWLTVPSLILLIIVVFKLISAHGLFRTKSWGRTLTIWVLACDFVVRLAGAINLWSYNVRHPEISEMVSQQASNSGPVHFVSAWPSYIIGITSFMFVMYLLRPAIKDIFVTA